MRAAIIQPNYIPWRGYFGIIRSVELFVFYDDVVFGTGKKWRNRNLIRTSGGTRWLTVPLSRGQGAKLIYEVRIDYTQNWIDRHKSSLQAGYVRAPFWDRYFPKYAEIIGREYEFLADLDIALTLWIMQELRIPTNTVRSRELGVPPGHKDLRPLNMLKRLGATEYVSGPTAKAYTDNVVYAAESVDVIYQSYDYAPYPQLWGEFQDHVSVLDLLFNTGPEASGYLVSSPRVCHSVAAGETYPPAVPR